MRYKNFLLNQIMNFPLIFVSLLCTVCQGQQTYLEQSTIDLFGNRQPIFNYMPNPGHVDVERLEHYQQTADLREEEGKSIFIFF